MLLRARDDAYLTRLSTVKPHNPASHSLGVVRQFPVDAEALALCGDSLASKMLAKQLSSAANRDGPVVWVGEPLHALTGHTVTVHDLRMATMFGGSILLAHLDDAPLAVQDLVLAVLDTPGLRFIFPSNTDLLDVSRRGTMRRPLAARLASASIWMPPLRERLEDLPLMARQRVADVTANGGALRALSAESVRRIAQYPWGGNRAELRTTIQRAVFLSQGPVLEVRPRQSLSRRRPIAKPLDPVIRDAVRDALTQTEWTIEGPNGAASLLGMPASTLRSKMKKLTIQR
jgi:DNA-binding NtrC family response regulator